VNRRNLVFLITLVVGTAIDQATKWWVIQNLRPRGVPMGALEEWQRNLPARMELIPGWLDFVHAQNPGAAFSMFADFESSPRSSCSTW
jgi:lipoprotein signal peptidase